MRRTSYGFDAAGRLTGLTNTTPAGIASAYTYAYNAAGNRKYEGINNADGSYIRHFYYDGADRLTGVANYVEGDDLSELFTPDEH